MLIRTATTSDCDEIEALELKLFPENSFNALTVMNEMRVGLCYVIYEGPTLVGYVLGRGTKELFDILRLGVAEGYQRQGLGSAMLQAVKYQYPSLMLTVRKSNLGAIRLYRRHGFTITGELSEGAWVMTTSSA